MGIVRLKYDNLEKFMDGLSLLDDQDKERVIGMVDILDAANRTVKCSLYPDGPFMKHKKPPPNADLKKHRE